MLRRQWIGMLLVSVVTLFVTTTQLSAHEDTGNDAPGKDAPKDQVTIVETVGNAFQGGEKGAEAQAQLFDMASDASYLLAMLFIGYLVASWVGRVVGNVVTKRVDVTLGKFLSKAVRNVILIVIAMVVLEQQYKINIAGFAAILAATGFAIGMALQGTLGNFAAGVMLLAFRPFKIDDYIEVADTQGTVEEIDLFTTRLNTVDNRHVIVPNAEIFGAKLENYTRNSVRRVDVNVGAAYEANLDQTRAALTQAVNRVVAEMSEDAKLDVPMPQVYLMNLGASSVDWQLRVWCDPGDYWAVRERLTETAKLELDKAAIGIPYPQMDVHVVGKVLAKAAA